MEGSKGQSRQEWQTCDHCCLPCAFPVETVPRCHEGERYNAEEKETKFERPGEQLKREACTQQCPILPSAAPHDARQSSEDQTSGCRGERSAPVAICPVTERAEFEADQESPCECPAR